MNLFDTMFTMNSHTHVLTHYQACVPLGRVIRAFTLPVFQGCSVDHEIVCILQAHTHTHRGEHRWFMVSVCYDLHDTAASSVCP